MVLGYVQRIWNYFTASAEREKVMQEEQKKQHTLEFLLRTGLYEHASADDLRELLQRELPPEVLEHRRKLDELHRREMEIAANFRSRYALIYQQIEKGNGK